MTCHTSSVQFTGQVTQRGTKGSQQMERVLLMVRIRSDGTGGGGGAHTAGDNQSAGGARLASASASASASADDVSFGTNSMGQTLLQKLTAASPFNTFEPILRSPKSCRPVRKSLLPLPSSPHSGRYPNLHQSSKQFPFLLHNPF
jgi:hypothetical protein